MNAAPPPPVPVNEYERLVELLDYDLDYGELQEELGNLAELAVKATGAKCSLVNLLDQHTQWSVARSGIELMQMPREESVCQHTIMGREPYEVSDLRADDRFSHRFYVAGDDGFRFYFGVPLTNAQGTNLGALCVLDDQQRSLDEDVVELLKLIAQQVVKRLEALRQIHKLQEALRKSCDKQRKLSHDVRGPVAGIIGLSEIVSDMLDGDSQDEAREMVLMMRDSGQSLIELVDGILTEDLQPELTGNSDGGRNTLGRLGESLQTLYGPQARAKEVRLEVCSESPDFEIGLIKSRLMQIVGNLISNAVKFTNAGGLIAVDFRVKTSGDDQYLVLKVCDNGVGMEEAKISELLENSGPSSDGTAGESGYGLGLKLVQHLIAELSGIMRISSAPGTGCRIEAEIPIPA